MATPLDLTPKTFHNPLPGLVLGDPFVLRHRGRFYLYGTNDGPPLPDGRQIPVFRSDDLLHWEPLGGALEPVEPGSDHWAPEVLAWNGRFYMVVSFGDVEHRGHALWVAVADRPEGPFRPERRVSDPSEAFSIDGAWLLDRDGCLYLFRCLDFVAEDDPPHGTGIVVQPMRDPLTPAGPARVVLRAHAPWQLFEADRVMPLYGGRTFAAWNTVEGPAPVRRAGRYFCGYSGGNYTGAYGTGEAAADHPLGPYTDLRGREGPLFATTPGLVEGPGHFSVIRADGLCDWIVLHGRVPGEHGRRVWLCPATWDAEGVAIGPLTADPQPAPRLPTDLSRFDAGALPAGWRFEGGRWEAGDGELRQVAPGEARAWREGLELSGDWVAEAYVRLPEPDDAEAGLAFEVGGRVASATIGPRGVRVGWDDAPAIAADLPTLGDEPINPRAFHALEVRCEGGRVEVAVDGVARVSGLPAPPGPARPALLARGQAAFDAPAFALGRGIVAESPSRAASPGL